MFVIYVNGELISHIVTRGRRRRDHEAQLVGAWNDATKGRCQVIFSPHINKGVTNAVAGIPFLNFT